MQRRCKTKNISNKQTATGSNVLNGESNGGKIFPKKTWPDQIFPQFNAAAHPPAPRGRDRLDHTPAVGLEVYARSSKQI